MTQEFFLSYNFYYHDKVYPENVIGGEHWEFETLAALCARNRVRLIYEGSSSWVDGTIHLWESRKVLQGNLRSHGAEYTDVLVGFTTDRLLRHFGRSCLPDSVFLPYFFWETD